ncbi:MAG TPA: hypothetical protein VJB06_02785 [archaeon]|nr:hypothetical protein [archaeon]
MKTVALSEETHRDLVNLKLQAKVSSTDELVHRLIIEHRKQRLEKASQMFRDAMKEKGLTLKDILKDAEKVRKEIYEERFGSGGGHKRPVHGS